MELITSKLRQRLQAASTELYARLQTIEMKAKEFIEYSQGGSHLSYTTHGFSHISAVEQNYDWLLSEDDISQFNSYEVFCLLCATFFHDALMVPKKVGDEAAARRDHVTRAHEFLLANREMIGLKIGEVEAISQIILAHGILDISEVKERFALGSALVDPRKLGACLSMADICHADSSRAPEIVYRHLELDKESHFHWRRHLQISGITRKGTVIVMTAITFSTQGDEAVREYQQAIENQLHIVRPYFQSNLAPITAVELDSSRLDSPLQQTLRFTTNTPSILKLLIEGVYQREDVFLRELVQNSMDACLIRRARELRRNRPYDPTITITLLKDNDRVRAVRIDDNGIGMDLVDVQDTLLTIGTSIGNKNDLTKLLQLTLQKRLIATFGIGLLSCFKVSDDIQIRTAKEGEVPLEFTLTGVSNDIRPIRTDDDSIGTTVTIHYSDLSTDKHAVLDSIDYYFRKIDQATIRILDLEWDKSTLRMTRAEIAKIAVTESELLDQKLYAPRQGSRAITEILGEDYSGSLWLPPGDLQAIFNQEGTVDILNEGIFVADQPTAEWIDGPLSACTGFLNFSSGAIHLQAARDGIVKDEKFRQKAQEVGEKSFGIISGLIAETKLTTEGSREFAALALTKIFQGSDQKWKSKIIKHLDHYQIPKYKSAQRTTLSEIQQKNPEAVYLQYSKGQDGWKSFEFNGQLLYHHEDDFIKLQAAIMAQDGRIVLALAHQDATEEGEKIVITEAALITEYFATLNIDTVDLTQQNVIEGGQRSKPVPAIVRQRIKGAVKFVEISELPNKMSWNVGEELWLNLANPSINRAYQALHDSDIGAERLEIVEIMVELLGLRFKDALRRSVALIESQSH